jgi:hypothetical protein
VGSVILLVQLDPKHGADLRRGLLRCDRATCGITLQHGHQMTRHVLADRFEILRSNLVDPGELYKLSLCVTYVEFGVNLPASINER